MRVKKINRFCLHIMHDSVFSLPYINFINSNFNKEEHFFFMRSLVSNYSKYTGIENIFMLKKYRNKLVNVFLYFYGYVVLFIAMITNKKLIFHGLFDPIIILILFCNKFLLRKSNWVIWGSDLYEYQERPIRQHILKKIYFKANDSVKENFNVYIACKGDYKFAEKYFNAKGRYFDCIGYLSNVYKEVKTNSYKEKKAEYYILAGNSADPINNHIEILNTLEKYCKMENILIYCPLSYGNNEWAKYVSKYGNNLFGSKFIPIIDFMPINKYLDFLSEIDIAIFANNRQHGNGNTISLLGMGKTVFLKRSSTLYNLYEEEGIVVYSFEEFNGIKIINNSEKNNNIEIVKNRFSEKRLKQDWKIIFENKG
jgi:dTDP-N-acetylfucosamine:lipid II N-acetylfucosaminyltransferase